MPTLSEIFDKRKRKYKIMKFIICMQIVVMNIHHYII